MKRPVRRVVLIAVGLVVAAGGGVWLDSWYSSARIIERARARTAADLESLRAEKVHRPPLFEPAEEGNAWDALSSATAVCTQSWGNGYSTAFKAETGGSFTKSETERDAFIDSMAGPLDNLKRGLRRSFVESNEWNPEASSRGHLDEMRMIAFLRDALRHRIGQERIADAIDLVILSLGLADRLKVKGTLWAEIIASQGDMGGGEALKRLLAGGFLNGESCVRLAGVLETLVTLPGSSIAEVIRRECIDSRHRLLALLDGKPWAKEVMQQEYWEPGIEHAYSMRIRMARALSLVDLEEKRFAQMEGSAPVDWVSGYQMAMFSKSDDAVDRRPWIALRILQWRMILTMARVSIAVARYGIDHEGWPSKLEALVPKYLPAVPVDPWALRPLRMAARGGEAEISSVEMDPGFLKAMSHSQYDAGAWKVWTVKARR